MPVTGGAPRRCIVAIHGVGDPKRGEIQAELAGNLRAAGLEGEIREFNWNISLPYRFRSDEVFDGFGWSRVKFLSLRLADACLIDWSSAKSVTGRWSWKAHYIAFQLTEWLFAFLLSVAAIVLPALFSMRPIDDHTVSQEQLELTLAVLTWAGRALVFAVALSAASAIVAAIAEKSTAPLRIATRRLGLLVLRPFVLLFSLLFSLPLTLLLGIAAAVCALLMVIIGGFIVFSSLFAETPSDWWPAVVTAIGLTTLLVATGLVVFMMRIGAPAFKILLDIFLYIADEDHRRGLQQALDKEFANVLSNWDELVIVAHSLGSVLALDSLLNSEVWGEAGDKTVTLLTCGSPIRRFFTRFFPDHLFPSLVDTSAHVAAARVGRLRWLNGYRPYDEIGTVIGLSGTGWTREFSTGQPSRWRSWQLNHSNYWSDVRVRELTVTELATLEYSAPSPGTVDWSVRPVAAPVGSSRHRSRVAQVLRWSTAVIALIVAGASLGTSIIMRRDVLHKINVEARTLLDKGVETSATVSVARSSSVCQRQRTQEQIRNSQPPQFDIASTDEFRFDYNAADKARQEKLTFKSGTAYNQAYDIAKFDQRIDSGRLMQEALKGHPSGSSSDTFGCHYSESTGKLDRVVLRYDADHPDVFVLPEFPPDSGLPLGAYIDAATLSLTLSLLNVLPAICVYYLIILLIGDAQRTFSSQWPERTPGSR